MYLDLNKPVGPVTGKWCVRRFRTVWAVYDGAGIWWGDFETFAEALEYAAHPIERLADWLAKQ